MNENKQSKVSQGQGDYISLKELIAKVNGLVRYLLGKWLLIGAVGLVCGALVLVYSLTKKTQYTAKLSFILEEQSAGGGSLSAAASIAEQLGFSIGGISGSRGFFQGDNIIAFLKSRSMIDQTLLTEVDWGGETDMLVSRYIEYNGLREKWKNKPHLKDIRFADTVGVYLQDSLMAQFYKSILKHDLVVEKPDKKYNIIAVEMETPDESFSKVFVETLIKNASDFYIQTRTQKAAENLAVLTRQVDSVRLELDAAIGGVAAAIDANPNPNPAFQRLRVNSQKRTVDVQANTAILTELVKNQELAKITLRNEKPIIQVLDKPILPLADDKMRITTALFSGFAVGVMLSCLFLAFRYIYRQIMSGDLA